MRNYEALLEAKKKRRGCQSDRMDEHYISCGLWVQEKLWGAILSIRKPVEIEDGQFQMLSLHSEHANAT